MLRERLAAASVAEKFGIARAHHGYESLLADTNLRVCDIAVPPAIQPGIIFDILRTAPHIQGILAQKPLASSLAEATVIVDACQKAGVCLVVNQNMRYDQSVRSAQSLLKAGVLGDCACDDRHAGYSALDALARASRMVDATNHVHSPSRYISFLAG